MVLKHCLNLPKCLFQPSRKEFKILIFIFWHHNYIPYLLDQKPGLLIFSPVAEGGYISRAATIPEQCLLMINDLTCAVFFRRGGGGGDGDIPPPPCWIFAPLEILLYI